MSQLSSLASVTVWYSRMPALLTRMLQPVQMLHGALDKACGLLFVFHAGFHEEHCAAWLTGIGCQTIAACTIAIGERQACAFFDKRTVASPMPDAPPVTAATFPLSRPMCLLLHAAIPVVCALYHGRGETTMPGFPLLPQGTQVSVTPLRVCTTMYCMIAKSTERW